MAAPRAPEYGGGKRTWKHPKENLIKKQITDVFLFLADAYQISGQKSWACLFLTDMGLYHTV